MKIEANDKGEIILKEVYSGVGLETRDGEFMGICMRDTGFEFTYQGKNYSAQNGVVSLVNSTPVQVVKKPPIKDPLIEEPAVEVKEQINPPPLSYKLKSKPLNDILQKPIVPAEAVKLPEDKKVEPQIKPPIIPQKTKDMITDTEKARGFVRPIRSVIVHKACGERNVLTDAVAEMYARDPKGNTNALCVACGNYFPVVEFNWEGIEEKVGS